MSEMTVVVLGASRNRDKFGNKAVRAYLKRSWTVYPVNPHADEIEGVRAYRSLTSVPGPVDRATIYLPPSVTLPLLDDLAKLRPKETFFNPGSESPQVIERARVLALNPISECSIVDIGLSPSQFPG